MSTANEIAIKQMDSCIESLSLWKTVQHKNDEARIFNDKMSDYIASDRADYKKSRTFFGNTEEAAWKNRTGKYAQFADNNANDFWSNDVGTCFDRDPGTDCVFKKGNVGNQDGWCKNKARELGKKWADNYYDEGGRSDCGASCGLNGPWGRSVHCSREKDKSRVEGDYQRAKPDYAKWASENSFWRCKGNLINIKNDNELVKSGNSIETAAELLCGGPVTFEGGKRTTTVPSDLSFLGEPKTFGRDRVGWIAVNADIEQYPSKNDYPIISLQGDLPTIDCCSNYVDVRGNVSDVVQSCTKGLENKERELATQVYPMTPMPSQVTPAQARLQSAPASKQVVTKTNMNTLQEIMGPNWLIIVIVLIIIILLSSSSSLLLIFI